MEIFVQKAAFAFTPLKPPRGGLGSATDFLNPSIIKIRGLLDWIPGELVVLFDIPNAQITRNSIFRDMAVIYIAYMLYKPELREIDVQTRGLDLQLGLFG